MRPFVRLVLSAALVTSAVSAFASGVEPGSKAPALSVKKWYKGKPVTSFKKNKIYVVEFWATWCGPCRESIPHLTELAKKNKDVTFLGVSIWEDDNGTNIKKFVADMGSKMDYNVGYSGNKTGMSQTWMEAAGQNGIPTAFVVKNGVIQWIGHPMELEKPLGEIKKGKFNLAKHKADIQKEASANREMRANFEELEAVKKLVSDGKFEQAEAKLDALDKSKPMLKGAIEGVRFTMLSKMDPAKWEAKAKELAENHNPGDSERLCMFALEQIQNNGDLAAAAKAMDFALAAARESDTMTYYYGATFYDQNGNPKKALELINKAVESLPKGNLKDNKAATEALTKIQADMAKKAKG